MKNLSCLLLVLGITAALCVQQGSAKGVQNALDKEDTWLDVKESVQRPHLSELQLNKMRLPNPVLVRQLSPMEKLARRPVLKLPEQVLQVEELTAQWDNNDLTKNNKDPVDVIVDTDIWED